MGLYFMLFAGGGAYTAPDIGGALSINVSSAPSGKEWYVGSALF